MFEKKTSLIRCYRRETTMSESKFEQTEVDVKILDRNDVDSDGAKG